MASYDIIVCRGLLYKDLETYNGPAPVGLSQGRESVWPLLGVCSYIEQGPYGTIHDQL